MAVYLKQFENHTQYENYINGSSAILPNVSICITEGDVYYNHYVEPVETKLVVYYDIQDISNPTTIFTNYDNSVKSIEIDGTLLDSVVTTYQFDSVGEHVIKYEFNNPTKVGDSAPIFYQIPTIKRVVIPNTFTSIGDWAFYKCSCLTSIDIPDSVTSIGKQAFSDCSGITSCIIGSGVTSIGDGAFNGCSGITSCAIGSGVTSIGDGAFSGCTSLTSIDIPSGVISIGRNAFANCSSLTSVTVNATTPPTLGIGAFNYTNNYPIYVPSASVETYKSATDWSDYANRIQAIS